MKLKQRAVKIGRDIKNSFKRFPITVGISFILAAVLIFLIETENSLGNILRDRLIRASMILGMGIFLSFIIGLIHERFNISKNRKLINYTLAGLFLVLYYIFLLEDFKDFRIIRYLGFMIFFFITIFHISRIKIDNSYEKYVVDIFSKLAVTIIYSIVLLLGIFFILLTLSELFELNIEGKWYMYTFLIIVFLFAVPYFASRFPSVKNDYKDFKYTKAFVVLLSYIVIPLITVYTIILYAYFLKILISWQWPKGLVSHLVLWYSSLSVGVLFLISPILEENKFLNGFKKYFPKGVLPILIMMFVSIGQRIGQYGFTEQRYFVVALGIWVFGIMVYFSFKKSLKNRIVPITLSIIVLNSVIGPISSFAISKSSQNSRLEDILERNNMIEEGQIAENKNISKEDKREINNIIYYFDNNHNLDDIDILDDDYTTSKTEDIFGFKYEPNIYYPIDTEKHFYLYLDLNNKVISLEDFEYEIKIATWGDREIDLRLEENRELNYKNETGILEIKEGDKILTSIDINDLALDIYEKNKEKDNLNKHNIDLKDMTYGIDNSEVKVKLIFNNISGRIEDIDNSFGVDKNLEFTIYINFK